MRIIVRINGNLHAVLRTLRCTHEKQFDERMRVDGYGGQNYGNRRKTSRKGRLPDWYRWWCEGAVGVITCHLHNCVEYLRLLYRVQAKERFGLLTVRF